MKKQIDRGTPKSPDTTETDFGVRVGKVEIGGRIKEAISSAGGIDLISDRTGIPAGTLSNYTRGLSEPKAGVIAAIARATNQPLDWLITGEGPMRGGGWVAGVPDPRPLALREGEAPPEAGYQLVPHYDIASAGGVGAMVADENIKGFLAFRAEWVHNVLGTAPSMLAALTAVGDSMSPTISPGDTLLIDRNVERITEGAIYVIEVDGALLTKRVQLRRDGTLVLRSDNAHYEPDQMPRAEARLIGRVRWIARLV